MEEHPVRFSIYQINFIRHMISELNAYDYWEEECADLVTTIEKAEENNHE